MIRSIVAPVDGSRLSEIALPWALMLARRAGASVRMVLAHAPMAALVPAAGMMWAETEHDGERRAREQTYLAETAARFASADGPPVRFELLDGLAGPAIEEYVERESPDLVVMATHGRGGLSRYWLGSVTDYLIRHVSVPMLLLHLRDGNVVRREAPAIRRILVPLDMSATSEAILESVGALACATQAHVTLFHVVETVYGMAAASPADVPPPPTGIQQQRDDAQQYLDEVASRLRARGHSVAAAVTLGFSAAATILGQLAPGRFDLVALSTHGAGRFKRLVVGSVADKVIRGAAVPVLTVRPSESVVPTI